MEAKDMFEKLGYELKKHFHIGEHHLISYQKGLVHIDISSFSEEISVCKWKPRLFGFLKAFSQDITFSELQAINQQMKEIGEGK